MLRRLFLVFLPSLTASVSYANEASWNCEQNKDSKEWVCVGEKKKAANAEQAAPAIKQEAALAIPPAATPAVEKTYPAPPTPAPESVKPEASAPVQAAEPENTAPVASRQTFIPETATAIPPVTAKPATNPSPAAPVAVQDKPALIAESVEPIQPPPAPKPALAGGKRSGWNCGANRKDANWDCQLLGSEPGATAGTVPVTEQGQTQLAETESPLTGRLLDPAFDSQQEQTFRTLTSQLPYDPWASCNVEQGPKRKFVSTANLRNVTPLDVKSNYAEVYDNEISDYFGNVKMARADQHSSSNIANYDKVSDILELHGDVYYSEDALALHSETATIDLAADQAKLRDVQFITPTAPLRGKAASIYKQSKTLSHYKDVAYTSCRPGNQDWVIHASELEMDKVSGLGTTKNTWIEFKGVPVAYTPYLSFPIDDRRVSGFLSPTFGNTKYSGFNLATPYYWNIAPNYDATLRPRYLTARGALLAGDFRYLTERSKGQATLEYMPNDSTLNTSRYLGSFRDSSQFTPHLSSKIDLNYVSDQTYISTLGSALSFSNYNFLRSYANVNYNNYGFSFTGLADSYQSINSATPTTALPYRRLPQLNLNYAHDFQFMPLHTEIQNEFVDFQHTSNLVDGQRINIRPSISIPLQTASAFFTPKLSLQHTQYALGNGAPGSPAAISRTLPTFSADSGMYLERNVTIADTPLVHTLEPRLFYLYVPYTNQNGYSNSNTPNQTNTNVLNPVFDSALYDFQYNTMFRENSFSGNDRIQDANQITTALTSRLMDDKAGLERLKLNVGEIIYFRDRLVSTPVALANGSIQNIGASTAAYSNLVTELSSELTHQISVTTGVQWNPIQHEIDRGKAAIHFRNQSNEVFNVGYLYRKNPLIPDGSNNITQSDVSFRWPIVKDWYVLGRWQYSLLYDTTQDSFLGLEKENCCWRFRILGRHYMNNYTTATNVAINSSQAVAGSTQNGIFFQIELKGLTGFGDDMDQFLQKSIYGFRTSQK